MLCAVCVCVRVVRTHAHEKVRALAAGAGLPCASRCESMGLCFVGKRNFPLFLSEYIDDAVGEIVSVDAPHRTIGEHSGRR